MMRKRFELKLLLCKFQLVVAPKLIQKLAKRRPQVDRRFQLEEAAICGRPSEEEFKLADSEHRRTFHYQVHRRLLCPMAASIPA